MRVEKVFHCLCPGVTYFLLSISTLQLHCFCQQFSLLLPHTTYLVFLQLVIPFLSESNGFLVIIRALLEENNDVKISIKYFSKIEKNKQKIAQQLSNKVCLSKLLYLSFFPKGSMQKDVRLCVMKSAFLVQGLQSNLGETFDFRRKIPYECSVLHFSLDIFFF